MRDDGVAIPFLVGTAGYKINVVGESFYEASFLSLCGARTIAGVTMEASARLTLQDDNPHDKYAVCVTIQGHPVGHLSRDDARAFRRLVRYGELSLSEVFECAAKVCGGWDRGEGDIGAFGVRLNLKLGDEF